MFVDLVANASTGSRVVRICRRAEVDSSDDALSLVSPMVEDVERVFQIEVSRVDVNETTQKRFDLVSERVLYFTNICGKVSHYAHDQMLRQEVLPLVMPVVNGFGRFSALYGPECNLLINNTRTVTMFRAARCSRGVQAALDLAIEPDSVKKCSVYMLVASARLSNPVCMQCQGMCLLFERDKRWAANCVVKTEEGAHIKSVRLTNFDAKWLETLDPLPYKLQIPSQMLVNVTKNGAVSMFLSVHDEFRVGVEHGYRPLYDAVLAVVSSGT